MSAAAAGFWLLRIGLVRLREEKLWYVDEELLILEMNFFKVQRNWFLPVLVETGFGGGLLEIEIERCFKILFLLFNFATKS